MNNFDMSTAGVNLELSCHRDTMYSQDLWDNNFLHLGDSTSNLYQFIDYGNFKEIDLIDINSYSGVTLKNSKTLMMEWYGSSECATDEALYKIGKSFSKLNKSEMIEFMIETLRSKYNDVEVVLYLSEHFTPNFDIIPIRGYNQGDYAEILFSHEDMEQYNFDNKDRFISEMKDYFINLFYDTPYYCRLELDGVEFDYNNYIQDEYNYDKDEILKITKDYLKHEKLEYILEWLDENLPEYPDYL